MKHILPALILLLAGQALASAQERRASQSSTRPIGPILGPELWVSGYTSAGVHRFHARTANVSAPRLPAPGAQSIVQGPDGLVYVAAEESNAVLRFAGSTALGRFIGDDPLTPQDESGGLDGPTAAIFGPDGNIYVASFNSDAVLLYDAETGTYLRHFIASGAGGLDGPDAGMTFGPDGDLYIPSFNSNRVLRYDGQSGAPLGIFINQGSGTLSGPRMLLFRPSGELWVSSWRSRAILSFDANGNFLRRLVTLRDVTGFAIGPLDGHLYATSSRSNRVLKYDMLTGQLIGTFIPSGADGLDACTFLAFMEPRR